MRISDWSSDVCSSDLTLEPGKMADVVLWSANPFSVYALADRVWIDGVIQWDRADPRYQSPSDFVLGQPGQGFARRSEERRVGKECVVRVDLGGRRIIKKKKIKYRKKIHRTTKTKKIRCKPSKTKVTIIARYKSSNINE